MIERIDSSRRQFHSGVAVISGRWPGWRFTPKSRIPNNCPEKYNTCISEQVLECIPAVCTRACMCVQTISEGHAKRQNRVKFICKRQLFLVNTLLHEILHATHANCPLHTTQTSISPQTTLISRVLYHPHKCGVINGFKAFKCSYFTSN